MNGTDFLDWCERDRLCATVFECDILPSIPFVSFNFKLVWPFTKINTNLVFHHFTACPNVSLPFVLRIHACLKKH